MQFSHHLVELFRFPKITILAVIFFSLTLVSAPVVPAIANLLMGLTLISFVLTKELRMNLVTVFKSRTGILILAWLICLVIYTLFTQSDMKSALRELSSWRKFLLLPIGLILFSCDQPLQKFALVIITVAFTLLALVSYLFYFTPELSIKTAYPGILMANYVAQALIFGVTALILIVFLYLNYTKMKWGASLAVLAIIGILLGNIFFISSGRSGYAAVFIMFVTAWLLLTVKLKWTVKLGGLALIVTSLALVAFNSPKVKERIDLAVSEIKSGIDKPEYTSLGIRITFYKETLKMAPKYLVFGAGTGGFLHAYEQQVSGYDYPANNLTADPHNQYLRILIEQGLAGLIIFLLLLMNVLFSPTTTRYMKILGVSVLVAWLTTSLFNSHFSTFNEGVFIWGWLGLCFAFPRSPQKSID